jgi:hypothetical protein
MRIAIVAVLLLIPGAALAQTNLRSACRSDYLKLCSAHRPGTPEVEACFRANIDQVSATCRDAIRASRGAGAAPAPASRGSDYR